jgi:geranylgeranyl pyrophosphate synthase
LDINKSEKLIVSLLDETSKIVEPEIVHHTRIHDQGLQQILDHALKPKGNRERPLLVRLSCEAVRGKFEDIIPAAVAIELLHFSTLVIDDVLDNSPLRGSEKTVFNAYGPKYAIIVAELLNSLAFLTLNDLSSTINDQRRILKVIDIFKKTQGELYYGQYLDLSFEHRKDTVENQYLDLVSKTTGSLIKCSLIAGAVLGGGQKEEIECLTKYGDYLGIAFQIRDDVADIVGEPQIIGKQLGGDIRQGKMRLPFIKALLSCNSRQRKFLTQTLRKRKISKADVERCIEILIKSGSIEYCKKVARGFSLKAVKHLEPLDNTSAKAGLIAFAEIVGLLW